MKNQIQKFVDAEIKNLHENSPVAKILINSLCELASEDCVFSNDIIREAFFDPELMYAYSNEIEDAYASQFDKLVIDLNLMFPDMEGYNDEILKNIEARYNIFLIRLLGIAVVQSKFLVEA